MAFKFFTTFALIALASAGIIPVQHEIHEIPEEHHHYQPSAAVYQHAAPVYHTAHAAAQPQHHVLLQKQHHEHHEEYPNDPHPQYNFAYDVKDAVSGDSKSQTESRDGDVVHGEYSLDDADGFRRIVKYTADAVNGFNAVVSREPLTHKVVAVPAPVHHYHHTPATAVVKAPVAYAAVAPTYATLPAHHDHHQDTFTSYEAPQHLQATHEVYHH